MYIIETILVLAGAGIGLIVAILLPFVTLVSFMKIKEADYYFGVGKLGGINLILTWPPWSAARMVEYGMLILFSHTHYMEKKYGHELDLIAAKNPPRRLKVILVWLYAIWFMAGCVSLAMGVVLWLFF